MPTLQRVKTHMTDRSSAFEEARTAFKKIIKISHAEDKDRNPTRDYYSSEAPSLAVEAHKDTVKRLYEVSLWVSAEDDTRFVPGAHNEGADRFWERVKPRAQLFTILMLLDSVKAHSKIWTDFLKLADVDHGPFAGFDNRHFPLPAQKLRDLLDAYEGQQSDKCAHLYDNFLSRQLQVCAVKIRTLISSDGPETYYEDRSPYADKGYYLPLSLKNYLAEGATGKVYRVKFAHGHFAAYNGKELAMKVFRDNDADADSKFELEWKHSKSICTNHRSHSSILTACAALKLERGYGGLLFFPLADHNLWQYMQNCDLVDSAAYDEKVSWIQEMANIVDALSFLHEAGRLHGDVKSENILVFDNTPRRLKLMLTDFGIKSGNGSVPTPTGPFSVRPRSPDSIGDDCVNRPPDEPGTQSNNNPGGRDIWGYGTILAEVLAWFQGKENLNSFELRRSFGFDNDQYWEDPRHPKIRKSVTETFDALARNHDGSLDHDTRLLYKAVCDLLKGRVLVVSSKDRAKAGEVHEELLKIIRPPGKTGRSILRRLLGKPKILVDKRTTSPDRSAAYANFCREVESSRYDPTFLDNYDLTQLRQFLILAMNKHNFVVVNSLGHLRFLNNANVFHRAAEAGDVQFFEELVEHRHEFPSAHEHINSADNQGTTPLLKAIQIRGREEARCNLVRHLLALGARANQSDNVGQTPLHYASEKAVLAVLKELLNDPHADVNKADNMGATPLHLCASGVGSDPQSDAIACTKFLVEAGADKKKQDVADRYPLHYALDPTRSLTEKRWKIVAELSKNTTNERNTCEQYVRDVFYEQQPRITREICWEIWRKCNSNESELD